MAAFNGLSGRRGRTGRIWAVGLTKTAGFLLIINTRQVILIGS